MGGGERTREGEIPHFQHPVGRRREPGLGLPSGGGQESSTCAPGIPRLGCRVPEWGHIYLRFRLAPRSASLFWEQAVTVPAGAFSLSSHFHRPMNKQWKLGQHPEGPPRLVTTLILTCSVITGVPWNPSFGNRRDMLCSQELPTYQPAFGPKHKVVLLPLLPPAPVPLQCHFGAAFQAAASERSAGNGG